MYAWHLYCIAGFSSLDIGYATAQDAIEGACDQVAEREGMVPSGYYTHANITRGGEVVDRVDFVNNG